MIDHSLGRMGGQRRARTLPAPTKHAGLFSMLVAYLQEHIISHKSINWATFPIFYGTCMEENTCEAKLSHINEKGGKKIGNIHTPKAVTYHEPTVRNVIVHDRSQPWAYGGDTGAVPRRGRCPCTLVPEEVEHQQVVRVVARARARARAAVDL